jgi:hypothetical protein
LKADAGTVPAEKASTYEVATAATAKATTPPPAISTTMPVVVAMRSITALNQAKRA